MAELDVSKIAVELVKQFSKPVIEGVKSVGGSAKDRLRVDFHVCFTKYLERSHERLSKTKTLLYRQAPVSIKKFYVRTDLSLGNNQTVKESDFIEEIEKNRRLVVSGTAGCGKSTFCKSVFLDLVEEPRAVFPIFIELRHLNGQKEKGLVKYVIDSLINIDPKFTQKQFDYALKLGKVLLILDGFDEINIENREFYEREMLSLSNNYQNILILISSRPDRRFASWEEFFHYSVLPLDKDKALALIGKLDYDSEVKKSFLKALEELLFEKHISFARNPLLLTMMLLTYEQIAEIPNKVHLFYEQAFLTLFNKHDSLKSLYKRESFSGLPLDEFKQVLSAFCVLSYTDRKYYFDEGEIDGYLKKSIEICGVNTTHVHFQNDLLDSVCILQRDGLGYAFTHRSFQEYFTALFVVNLTSNNRYEIFDKIAFINDRDNVISMIFDINPTLLEQAWVVPRIESLIHDYSMIPSTNEGKLEMLSKTYSAIVTHDYDGHEPEAENSTVQIAYRLYDQPDDHPRFLMLLQRLYDTEAQEYWKKNKLKRHARALKAEADLVRLDIIESMGLDITNLNDLKQATKNRILRAGLCDQLSLRIDFAKNKLDALRKKHKEKDKNITQLLLGMKS